MATLSLAANAAISSDMGRRKRALNTANSADDASPKRWPRVMRAKRGFKLMKSDWTAELLNILSVPTNNRVNLKHCLQLVGSLNDPLRHDGLTSRIRMTPISLRHSRQ